MLYENNSEFLTSVNTTGVINFKLPVVSDLGSTSCVPFISQYSDCTDANKCSGCTRCSCSVDGSWSCGKVFECSNDEYIPVNDETLDNALSELNLEVKKHAASNPEKLDKENRNDDLLLAHDDQVELNLAPITTREKRSVNDDVNKNSTNNGTVKFYHTTDELNEDTLKSSNISGTLTAAKIQTIPVSRRKLHNNKSDPLHIENKSQVLQHFTNNKIDVTYEDTAKNDEKHEEVPGIVTNFTIKEKDHDLTNIVVKELKSGREVIGDVNAPVISNVSYRLENDTLTAMAFIAGNLLNKLWNIEKNSMMEMEDTENMKREKITDLLNLFKEPMTMRQESFLRNTLQKLSDAIDKNKDNSNVTICTQVEEAKKIIHEVSNLPFEKTEVENTSVKLHSRKHLNDELFRREQINNTSEAISKLNNVLKLIRKYENVNKNLNILKIMPSVTLQQSTTQVPQKHENLVAETLSDSESDSINTFGKILQKITKLLLPENSSKKMMNKVRYLNFFNDAESVVNKFREMYKINLENVTLTAKDKLILDYLSKINSGGSCLFGSEFYYPQGATKVEGDILKKLFNLSHTKEYAEINKFLEPEKHEKPIETTTHHPIIRTETTTVVDGEKKFNGIKEKFKSHLKTILDDLMELQNEKGIPSKEGQIKLADALPCIYNILASNDEIDSQIFGGSSTRNSSRLEKITKIFDALKKDFNAEPQTGRNTLNLKTNLPKSAQVWERTVKNLAKRTSNLRRNINTEDQVDIGQLLKIMESISKLPKIDKSNIKPQVDPVNKLMLLKTLEVDVKRYIDVLNNIKLALRNIEMLSEDKVYEFDEFVSSAAGELKVNEKVLKSLIKPKYNTPRRNDQSGKLVIPNDYINNNKNIKVSRDDILNQLIKNRVQMYLKVKKDKSETGDDINYRIGRSILKNLELGNYRLAREMYKVFAFNKKEALVSKDTTKPTEPAVAKYLTADHESILDKQPLVEFLDSDEPKKEMKLMKRDDIMRQLLNMRNMKIR